MRYWTILLFLTFAKVLCVPLPIVGGRNAELNKYAYQVSLRYPFFGRRNAFHFCGGSIITNKCILTAAHCTDIAKDSMYSLLKTLIFAGSIQPDNDNVDIYGIISFKTHEQFDRRTVMNDIAIITASETIRYHKYIVWPIALARFRPNDGAFVTVTGWGSTRDGDLIGPERLQVITSLQVLNLQRCIALNPLDPNCPNENVTDKNICIFGGVGQSTCQGDSGGPAVYNNQQIGIVSFGSDGCEKGMPSVLVSVSDYMDWIRSVTGII